MSPEQLLMNALFAVLGLVSHILKKAVAEKINPVEYVRVHPNRTYASLGSIVTAYATLLATRPDASPMEYFAIGYVGDSVFNRSPTQQEVEIRKATRALK